MDKFMKSRKGQRPRRTVTSALAAFALALPTFVAMGGTAAASETFGCPRGAACIVVEPNTSPTIDLITYGNWDGLKHYDKPAKIVNNGYTYPGADHVRIRFDEFSYYTGEWVTRTKCAHRPPSSNNWAWINYEEYEIWAQEIWWGGEC